MAMQITTKLAQKNRDAFHAAPVTIGFLGDSVTNGCFEVYPAMTDEGERGFDVVFEPENSYAANTRKILSLLYPKAQINIINAGISGDSAPGGLARMERDLLPYHPDLVVVCYGLNDSGAGDNGIARYHDSLVSIINKLKDAGCEVIVMTPQPICARVHTQLRGDGLRAMAKNLAASFADGGFDRYMQSAREAAEETAVPLCDVYAKWMAMFEHGVDITDLLSNYLNHPTRELHYLFAYSLVHTMFGLS